MAIHVFRFHQKINDCDEEGVLRIAISFAIAFAVAGVVTAGSSGAPAEAFQDLRWRLLGPLRAGWSTCAEGVTDEPGTFYFGAVDGGVWKTTNAGLTWKPLADHAPFSSVETLAITAGNPRVIYVGTGQVSTRYDIMDGTGVYKSEDEGKTWIPLGLSDTQHIGRILIDPRDSNVVLVAALGHLFAPNAERGVFRSEDGGRTWQKVLFVDENTGAVDLAADPSNSDIVYAALWQVRLYPWLSYFLPQVGPGSGIWKSTDSGTTWIQTARKGLPDEPLSRIGLAVAVGTGGRRVYASVAAPKRAGLYRSDDGGASWQLMSADEELADTYFGHLTADPKDPDTVYAMGRSVHRSTDGGKTFAITKGAPGGDDYHFFWINPKDPDHSILASDQGTAVTIDGGKTWSPWYNQATGQFYRLSADNRFPYWIYSGQQDCGSVAIASRSDYGQLTFRDWHPVGADERDYDIPDPDDPDVVFGSGLGGRLSRWDARTGRVANVSPWPVSSYSERPTTVKYRYPWITTIAISPRPGHALYQGAQFLFRSMDKGQSWQIMSPDLTGADPDAKDCGGDMPVERATACGYGTISSIAPSSLADGLLWIGTDNGRIMLTRDDGKSWTNVLPTAITDWSKIAAIDPSPVDPASATLAVDRYRLDDGHPYIYSTHDYGRTWTAIAQGIPEDSRVNVVRQDPVRPGLLYAGTRNGVFISFDDGTHWQPLQLNLPRTGVNDLLIHGTDLIAATQGRALWILDDVTPLRYLDPVSVLDKWALAPPAPAVRISKNENRDTPLPPEVPTTPNPPVGAIIDYFLSHNPSQPVTLEILSEKGEVVRSFRSDDKPDRVKATQYFADEWLLPHAALPARAGHNRFVWDLRCPRPKAPEYEYSIAAVPGTDTPVHPQGIQVLPGRYTIRLSVEGNTLTQPLNVEPDPRFSAKREDLEAQFAFYSQVAGTLAEATEKLESAKALDQKLDAVTSDKVKPKNRKELREAKAKRLELAPMLATTGNRSLTGIVTALTALATDLEGADGPPTAPQRDVYADCKKRLQPAAGQ